MQRAIWFFPVGVLVGAALAFVLLTGFSLLSDPAASPGIEPPRTPENSEAGPPPPGAPPAAGEAPGFDLHEFSVGPEHAVTYWSSLAVADAIAGRADGFLADTTRLIEAGGDPEDVQKMLAYLPKESAAGVMERLMAAFPDRPWDRWFLSDLYVRAGEKNRAFDLLLEELEAGSGDPESVVARLVRIDPQRAGSVLLVLSEKLHWDPSVLIFCAGELVDAGQPSLARPLLLQALEIDAANEEAIDLMSAVDPTVAMDLASKAVEAAPEDEYAWIRLARLRQQAGDLPGAFLAYHRAAALTENPDERLEMMRGMIQTDPAAALPAIEGFAEGADDETLGVLGQAYLAAGQRELAFGTFVKAHEFDPSDSEWLHRLVAIDPVRAAADFARQIERTPGTGNDELLGTYALSLERQGKLSEAYDGYLRAWRLDEEDWEWMRGLARTNPSRAVDLLEEKHREFPESGVLAGALADAYAGLGRTSEAIRLYEQAIEAGDEQHRWMSALAAAEPARGLPMLKAALEEDPEDDEYWGALGDAYFALGRMDEAKDAYDHALTLDPGDWEWSVQRSRIR